MKWVCVVLLFLKIDAEGQRATMFAEMVSTRVESMSRYQYSPRQWANHPAVRDSLMQWGLAFSEERPYLVAGFKSRGASAVVDWAAGRTGVQIGISGWEGYVHEQFGFSFSRKMGTTSAGFRFIYGQRKATGNPGMKEVGAELRAVTVLTQGLTGALQFVIPASLQGKERSAPVQVAAGMGYDFSPLLYIGGWVWKSEGQPPELDLGVRYIFLPGLASRLGWMVAEESYYSGVAYEWKSLVLEFQWKFHPVLGPSPGLMLSWKGRKGK